MSDERRTFCPEDGRPCYTPKGPEPDGFRCANYVLCKSFEPGSLVDRWSPKEVTTDTDGGGVR